MKEQKEAELAEERLMQAVGMDEMSRRHQQELAQQNKQLSAVKLQAEQKVQRLEESLRESHEVQEGLQRKVRGVLRLGRTCSQYWLQQSAAFFLATYCAAHNNWRHSVTYGCTARPQVNDLAQMLHDVTATLEQQEAAQGS